MAVTIAEYKNQLKALGYAEQTMILYGKGLSLFKEYLEGEKIADLRTVTKKTMLDYQAHVMAGDQAMETKALRLRPVKRLFEHLTRTNQLLINPAEGIIETNRRHRKIGPTLTRQEMKKLLEQPNLSLNGGIRDRAIMEVLYATALRIDELLALSVHDVDVQGGVIFVRKGKGKRQRVVPMGKHAMGFLKEYLEKVRPRFGRRNLKERRLFLNVKGEPMNYANVRLNLRQYARQAGIEKSASPHVFRRSCATHMLQQGADIRHIQQLLGHASLATTQQYTKVMPVDIKKTHEETHPNGREQTDAGVPIPPASPRLRPPHRSKRQGDTQGLRPVPARGGNNRR